MKKTLALSLVLVALMTGCSSNNKVSKISIEEAKTKSVEFINGYLMQEGNEVSIKEVVEENGIYKVVVNVPNGQEINSYLSLDGKKFFPQAPLDIAEYEEKAKAQEGADTSSGPDLSNIEKREKPQVELFVMSHCPYGTQIEKGILPVIETLGDKIDFELKFCDYAMHGEIELKEQLVQYCIQENEPEKLSTYLGCFLSDDVEKGSENIQKKCLTEAKIGQNALNNCVAKTDQEYSVMDNFADQSTYKGRYPTFNIYKEDVEKYGISGSPGFVINATKISANRDAASLLETVCAGFENAPEECNTALSTASPSAGFGMGTGNGADASCGS